MWHRSAATLAILSVSSVAASATPPQLHDKTISLSWSVSQSLKAPDGRIVNPSTSESRIIYVSSAGRLFIRSARNTAAISRSNDYAPGDRNRDDRSSQVSGWRFQGNQLVAMSALSGSGGSRVQVSFDPSFSSCTLSVVFGRSGGQSIRFRGIDGVNYEAISMSAGNPTCSIRSGNAFGGN